MSNFIHGFKNSMQSIFVRNANFSVKKVQSKVSVLSLQSGIVYPSAQPFRQNPVTCSHTFPALHLPHGCRKQNVVRIQE